MRGHDRRVDREVALVIERGVQGEADLPFGDEVDQLGVGLDAGHFVLAQEGGDSRDLRGTRQQEAADGCGLQRAFDFLFGGEVVRAVHCELRERAPASLLGRLGAVAHCRMEWGGEGGALDWVGGHCLGW